ncbi:MAG: hypothetical protein Q8L86_15875 [Vicinamibacterales bacterium]|nr:hypothetical protein [Vicinamibacterales bacterium]
MAARPRIDHKLNLKTIPVVKRDGHQEEARAEGNNAAWTCSCGTLLVGRCYFQFGDTCRTECPECGKIYRVTPDPKKRAISVVEQASSALPEPAALL